MSLRGSRNLIFSGLQMAPISGLKGDAYHQFFSGLDELSAEPFILSANLTRRTESKEAFLYLSSFTFTFYPVPVPDRRISTEREPRIFQLVSYFSSPLMSLSDQRQRQSYSLKGRRLHARTGSCRGLLYLGK